MDVFNSALRGTRTARQTLDKDFLIRGDNNEMLGLTLITLKTIMSPYEPTSKGFICNKSEYLER